MIPRSNRVAYCTVSFCNGSDNKTRLGNNSKYKYHSSCDARMPGVSSSTGLIAARVQPIYKPKPKKIELSGTSRPAPFTLRPFAGLFNPFPYGCSVLCNHPADYEAKEFVKRAKESWATEGKTLLLPTEMELIRATLIAGGIQVDSLITPQELLGQETTTTTTTTTKTTISAAVAATTTTTTTTTVPEELFRKYTETDSRPLTPTPTLASGPLSNAHRNILDETTTTCNPRERTTLILDLRTASQEQEVETFSWHALTLEPPPSPKRPNEVSKPVIHQNRPVVPPPPSPVQLMTAATFSDQESSRNEEQDDESESDAGSPIKRRGKKLKKKKCRRGSAYGQQNEVRGPLEPLETQVSQVDDESRNNSGQQQIGIALEGKVQVEEPMALVQEHQPYSFLSSEIIRHLGRELDRETVEEEFNLRRKIALEETLRVKGETQPNLKTSRPQIASTICQNAPRVFSRQSARFELLDSGSLVSMKPLDYLGKFVFLTPGRKLIFGRTFNKFYEDTMDGFRYIQPNELMEALEEVIGKALSEDELEKFKGLLGEIKEPLNFRTWCGVCAVCERLLSHLPPREVDPPSWIERADFEALERRLKYVNAHPMLVKLLREIRDQ